MSRIFTPHPTQCDLCSRDFARVMYDAKTTHGPWGCLCDECFQQCGLGLGRGRGQKYVLNSRGQFEKVAG